jgi:serine/threonine-protein kinase RsbT
MNKVSVAIKHEEDVITARRSGREIARGLGFGLADQTRLATAISELTRNVVQYDGPGECIISDESTENLIKIRVLVEVQGPGIPDIEKALSDDFSTGDGLGMGLPAVKRLVHRFDIQSRPGQTTIVIEMVMKQ